VSIGYPSGTRARFKAAERRCAVTLPAGPLEWCGRVCGVGRTTGVPCAYPGRTAAVPSGNRAICPLDWVAPLPRNAAARNLATMVWTGTEMIVWAGYDSPGTSRKSARRAASGSRGDHARRHSDEFGNESLGPRCGDITAGPDGNVWLTQVMCCGIARVTPGGTITKFDQIPAPAT
jgi:hypothetical protein